VIVIEPVQARLSQRLQSTLAVSAYTDLTVRMLVLCEVRDVGQDKALRAAGERFFQDPIQVVESAVMGTVNQVTASRAGAMQASAWCDAGKAPDPSLRLTRRSIHEPDLEPERMLVLTNLEPVISVNDLVGGPATTIVTISPHSVEMISR
jgi:hypothetical protein